MIEPACEASLRELERRGYRVWRVHGYKQIDLARCQMASDALAAGCEETLWIDADTGFHPDAVERLRAHDLPIVCGIYPKKNKRELAIHALPGTKEIVFGKGGGLIEILYAPTGFLLVRRDVYDDAPRAARTARVSRRHRPHARARTIAPLIRPDGDGWWYLADDFAFCERARQCGYKIMADTTHSPLAHRQLRSSAGKTPGPTFRATAPIDFSLRVPPSRKSRSEWCSRSHEPKGGLTSPFFLVK